MHNMEQARPQKNTANPLNIKQLQRYNSFRKQTTAALSNFLRTATRVGKVLTISERLAIPTGSEAPSGPTLPGCPGSLTTLGFSFSVPDTMRRHVCAEMEGADTTAFAILPGTGLHQDGPANGQHCIGLLFYPQETQPQSPQGLQTSLSGLLPRGYHPPHTLSKA